MTIQLISDKKATANITSIKTSGAKLDSLIHETGLYIINQVNQYGRIDLFNKFLGAMNKSARKESLILWLKDHCKIVQKKDKTFEYKHDRKLWLRAGVEATPEQALEKAASNPFWDYTKEVQVSSPMFYFGNRLQSIIDALVDTTKPVEIEKGKPMTAQERQDAANTLKALLGSGIASLPEAML